MSRCAEPGCKRQPAYPDQRFCEAHRLRWLPKPRTPAWVERLALNAKDFSGRAA